jgi:hypothetical protein
VALKYRAMQNLLRNISSSLTEKEEPPLCQPNLGQRRPQTHQQEQLLQLRRLLLFLIRLLQPAPR